MSIIIIMTGKLIALPLLFAYNRCVATPSGLQDFCAAVAFEVMRIDEATRMQTVAFSSLFARWVPIELEIETALQQYSVSPAINIG